MLLTPVLATSAMVRFLSLPIRIACLSLAATLFVYCWLFIQSSSLHGHVGCRHISSSDQVRSHSRVERHFSNRTLKCAGQHDIGDASVSSVRRDVLETGSPGGTAHAQAAWTNRRRTDQVINLMREQKTYSDEGIDKHEYNYIHNPKNICRHAKGEEEPVYVLFLVVTSPGNQKRRDVVRSTYGDYRWWPQFSEGTFKRVFLLGATKDAVEQRDIDREYGRYGDIVQEDFVDSYGNLTRKTVMGLKWATRHCRHALYVMKVDDDTMINQERFLLKIHGAPDANWTAGLAMYDAPVLRNASNKYYVSKEFYPSPTYPPYLNGPAYVLSADLAEASYKVALTTPLFPWEDVFLGICLQKLGVELDETTRFLKMTDPVALGDLRSNSKALRRLRLFVAVTNLKPEQMRIVWESGKLRYMPQT